MDVRCERCQTEYEIEDARISDLGTEVQCGDCGHLFTVKRSPTDAVAVAPAPGTGWTDGSWHLVTRLGQALELRDLGQLHTWIIERRVTRDDRISRDGQSWQPLGQVSELAPFFDIVDSAERARSMQAIESPTRLVPLQPPILIPPAPATEARNPERRSAPQAAASHASGGTAADSVGALPQAVDIGETEMIQAERRRTRTLLKLAIMIAIASGIGFGGIVWQRRNLRPAVISTSGAAADVSNQAASALPLIPTAPTPTASAPEPRPLAVVRSFAPETIAPHPARTASRPLSASRGQVSSQAGETAAASGDETAEPKAASQHPAQANDEAPQSLAAQGYLALGHHQYLQAIKLFHKELARSPINGTAIFGLAEAYRSAGRRQRALDTYRRYVEILPHGPNVGSARFHIRNLEAKMR